MKKLALLLIAIIILIAGGFFIFVHFISGGPWQGTWWGVQDAGINWSGDNIRNLETINFTKNEDGTINVDHKVQQGSREVDGSLAGTGVVDGGRLVVTPKKGGKDLALSYNTISKTMDTPFTNADGSTVTLKPSLRTTTMKWNESAVKSCRFPRNRKIRSIRHYPQQRADEILAVSC